MRFQFDGKTYAVEFQRNHLRVHRPYEPKAKSGNKIMTNATSTFPYTTVSLLEVQEDKNANAWPLIGTATVGCRHNEKFSLEKGRIFALRNLTRTIPNAMRPFMWDAYIGRPKGKKS